MSFYDYFLNYFKNRFSKNQITNENFSGAILAELIIISSTLIAALLLRHISIILTVVVILILLVLVLSNLPISIKFFQEQDDSIEKMTFYAIVCLGIIVSLVYWGGL